MPERVVVYGLGGYDPSKPNNNVIHEYEIPDPEPSPIEAALAAAKEEIKSLSPAGATRQAFEALITAIEQMI